MGTSDRKPYETATVLDQDFLDVCFGNLTNQLEMIVDIDSPTGVLHLSDRNKYVGSTFYEARLVFPVITRTIGELLSPELEFSSLTLEINNADGFYNSILPAGDDYAGWIDRQVTVKLGLRDVASTYKTIFSGKVTNEGGFSRTMKSFTLVARNRFDSLNSNFPTNVFTKTAYPDLGDDKVNLVVPVIYGDWTLNVEPDMASVTAFIVNEDDPNVTGDTSPHSTKAKFVISDNDLTFFDSTEVYVKRGSSVVKFTAADIVNVGAGNKSFEIRQSATTPAGVTLLDGAAYDYERGDEIYVKVKGKDLGAYDDNLVSQAVDILETFAGVSGGDFTSAWNTYRGKSTPAQSAISTFKSRVWIQQPQPVLTFVLSLLEQVRLEAFINRDGLLGLASLHFEDFVASPTFSAKLWDVEEGSLNPKLDDRNNFNRAQGVFNFLPNRNENFQQTKLLRNDAAITQAGGREISKQVVYPNLYDEATVQAQLTELLRLVSANIENVYLTLTWRAMLLDIGDFIALDLAIEGVNYENVPALVREISYDPQGPKVPLRVFSTQVLPFPGWAPAFSGITGGYSATITEE